jgi:hypothetical protein
MGNPQAWINAFRIYEKYRKLISNFIYGNYPVYQTNRK